jgi:phospholipase C
MLDDAEPDGINWETLAETFEKSGISWKVYMEIDNFDDNAFAWFDQFKKAKSGDPLH